ncbi:MAG TPA: hypothetical protein VHF26_18575 [Trebonia sp.]|nr:hypothetical protein [Trebonia sp.]
MSRSIVPGVAAIQAIRAACAPRCCSSPTGTSPPGSRPAMAAGADFLTRAGTGNSAPELPVLERLPDRS